MMVSEQPPQPDTTKAEGRRHMQQEQETGVCDAQPWAPPPRTVSFSYRQRTLYLRPWGLLAVMAFGGLYIASIRVVWHGSVLDLIPGGLLFAGTVLSSVLAHESGHAVAGVLNGHRLNGMCLGVGGEVYLEGTLTGRQLVIISAAGPLSGLLFDTSVIVATGLFGDLGPYWLAVGLSAYVCAINNFLNLLVPISGNSDAKNLYRGIRETLASTTAAAVPASPVTGPLHRAQ